ncbi:EcsC family protein [Inquilinus sp. 2KB_12]|uniref:EcsC family protein n=1 Tax=Inquilinus sp. 2KB_12 TaxID=3232975 RepID=UPI003F902F58
MTTTAALPVPLPLPPDAMAELAAAKAVLDQDTLTARLSALAGTPVEALKRNLPAHIQSALDGAVRRALTTALKAALRSGPGRGVPRGPEAWLHRGLAAASGAAGGAFGLPGTLLELPVSTTLLLRQIAAEAAAAGEDPASPETAVECLKVFALGRPDPADDAVETGYLATRIALARVVPNATAAVMPRLVSAVAARFSGPVLLKLSAQAAPVLGAAAGATVNLAFLEHFRRLARAHFTVRRLERTHGLAAVRLAYDSLGLPPRPTPPPALPDKIEPV